METNFSGFTNGMNVKDIKSLNYVSNWPERNVDIDVTKLENLVNLAKLDFKINHLSLLKSIDLTPFENLQELELTSQEGINVLGNLT